jgi:hypothetical protein
MRIGLLAGSLLLFHLLIAQHTLKPGFDAKEYAELLSLTYYSSSIPDSNARASMEDPYKLIYRSQEMGFRNRWTMYIRNDNTGVIDLRGTINQPASWMANFYAAMIPATGKLDLNDSVSFHYQFAGDPKAMVHVGWAISMAHFAPDILEKIRTRYQKEGTKNYFIFGHSQGGALSFLLRSLLEYEKSKGNIPSEIVFKTYCSAAPKPGNMYYAYDFDFITRGGWAFNVVNAADWVPETPFSIQTLDDFNPTNPLIHTKEALKKQKLLIRMAGGLIYNKLDRAPRKAQKKFTRYVGKLLYRKGVKKVLPQLQEPSYANGNNYMRAGIPIILQPDEAYRNQFPESDRQFFIHHQFRPYYYLLKKWYP